MRFGLIGAGAIGLELGSVWSRLGAKVTGSLTLGGTTYYRLGYGLAEDATITEWLGAASLQWEVDFCRDKQPGAPEGPRGGVSNAEAQPLPGARLFLPDTRR